MNNHRRRQYVERMCCKLMLLGHPVMDSSDNFVTVAFDYAPRANDYERFEIGGWRVHGHIGHNDMRTNTHDRKFLEVTFRRLASVSKPAIPVTIQH